MQLNNVILISIVFVIKRDFFGNLLFIITTDVSVNLKNVSCHESVSTSTRTVVTIKKISTKIMEPTIRSRSENRCPMNAFMIRNSVFGIADATLRSDVKAACIGVRTSVELFVVSRNLYIQYCKEEKIHFILVRDRI